MNIVFDLGGVVFEWNPKKLAQKLFQDTATQELFLSDVVGSQEWLALDKGILKPDEFIARIATRTRISATDVGRILSAVPPSLVPINGTIQIIKELKEQGFKIYVLSNMHDASIDYIEDKYDFWYLFDGKVISCRIKKVKPEPEIFRYTLDIFQLSSKNTLFIDDMVENLEAAKKFGIQTVYFENPEQCRIALISRGVFQE